MIKLQNKRYLEDNASREEIDAIKNRIDSYDKDVIFFKEMPIPTGFVQKLFFEKLLVVEAKPIQQNISGVNN